MPILRKFTPIDNDAQKKHKIPKLSLMLGAGDVIGKESGVFIAISVVAVVFLAVWIAGLVRMRRSCPGVPPSIFWVLTLVLGLVPTGATQLAALVMAIVGLVRPAIGCAPRA